MKKRYGIYSLFILPLIFSMASCSIINNFIPYEATLVDTSFIKEETEEYLLPDSFKPVTYINNNDIEESIDSYKTSFRHGGSEMCLDSLGSVDLLVIPVEFTDYTFSNKDNAIKNISNAFFGDPKTNKWESVASYYNKSSYNRLKIDGKVSDCFLTSYTFDYLSSIAVSTKIITNIKKEAVSWYKENYDDFDRFDKNGDGEPDALYLIYSCPPAVITSKTIPFFWAYVVYNKSPVAWSSYSLCYEIGGIVDSHTYIHEVAHMFGLKDYYDVDGIINPLYHADMMDYNIGDHTGYSKMLLEWVRPYYIKKDTTLKIRPFTSSGDLVLLKTNWNGSPMDEYILLEYYAPQGLNNYDAKHQLGGVSLFNQTGLKVYHVDSRLGFVEKLNERMVKGYVDSTKLSQKDYLVKVINSNSNRSYNQNLLYQLLPRVKGSEITSDVLFQVGDSFSKCGYQDYSLHDGGSIGFDFEIVNMTNTYCEIKFVSK